MPVYPLSAAVNGLYTIEGNWPEISFPSDADPEDFSSLLQSPLPASAPWSYDGYIWQVFFHSVHFKRQAAVHNYYVPNPAPTLFVDPPGVYTLDTLGIGSGEYVGPFYFPPPDPAFWECSSDYSDQRWNDFKIIFNPPQIPDQDFPSDYTLLYSYIYDVYSLEHVNPWWPARLRWVEQGGAAPLDYENQPSVYTFSDHSDHFRSIWRPHDFPLIYWARRRPVVKSCGNITNLIAINLLAALALMSTANYVSPRRPKRKKS